MSEKKTIRKPLKFPSERQGIVDQVKMECDFLYTCYKTTGDKQCYQRILSWNLIVKLYDDGRLNESVALWNELTST